MSRIDHRFGPSVFFAIASGVLIFSGCNGSDSAPISAQTSKYKAADEQTVSDNGPSAPRTAPPNSPSPSASEKNVDPYLVPEGAAEELMAYIQGLESRRQREDFRGATQEAVFTDFQNIQNAIIEATEKVLAGQPNEKIRQSAAQSKILAMQGLAGMNLPGAMKNLRDYCTTLVDDKNPELAQLSTLMLFGMDVDQFNAGEQRDPEPILDSLRKILTELELNMAIMQLSVQAAMTLQQNEFKKETIEAFKLIAEAAGKSKNSQIAAAASEFLFRARIIELDIQEKVDALLQEKPESAPPLLAAVKSLLGVEKVGAPELSLAKQMADLLERTRHYGEVKELYQLMETKYKGHEDKEIASFAMRSIEYGLRRANLMGQPFEVGGSLPSGESLDWSQYQGKVVLVDFWASWCRPCLDEIPNIEKNYKLYRDKGFEVVGVNLDENPLAAQQFFANQKLPWATVLTPEPKKPVIGKDGKAKAEDEALAGGFTHPLAVQCGVESIPFIVLVGKGGKVIDLHVRGEMLGERLAQLLGPSEDKQDAEKPSEKPTDKASSEKKGPEKKEPEKKSPSAEKQSSLLEADSLGAISFVALSTDDDKGADDNKQAEKNSERNPYEPSKDLSTRELVDFLFDMQEKPKSIQQRPGFSEAIVMAADRILAASDAKDRFQVIAAQAIFHTLHEKAVFADEKADQQLKQFVEKMKGDKREKIAREVNFFQLERRAIEADKLSQEKIPELLTELKKFFSDGKPSTRHLRIASCTIAAVNRIENADQREAYYQEFGKLFVQSEDRQLARYGRNLSRPSSAAPSELLGKPLELAGFTALGTPLDWASYRGKVVLVDFWATWCGPCRKEMPHVLAFHKTLKERGFAVVGVNLDKDPAALGKFLDEHEVPWSNLIGEESQNLAVKYGVRGIPTMMVVDRQGKIAAIANRAADLTEEIEKLLKSPATAKDEKNIAG